MCGSDTVPAKPQPCLDAWQLALLLVPRPETTEATKRRSCSSRQGMGGDTEETWRPEAARPASRPESREARRTFQLRSPPADCSRGCQPSRDSQQSAESGEMGSPRCFQLLSFGVVSCVKKGSSPTMTSWVSRLLPRNGRSLATASEKQRAEDRRRHQEAYGYFLPIQTRWQDNDQYGHVNNVVYYSYFDTIINQYLIRYCGLKTGLLTSPMVGFMATNQCTFHTPVSFPQIPVAALAVEKVGRSSVHYRLALFPPKPTKETPSVDHWDLSDGFFFGHPKLAHFAALACTTGSSVHVFVNPATSKPVGLPEDFRRGLLRLMRPAPG
ncbi:unnamed protein product [Rangifer tarandus platyrhynchus]|uniref:Uncharacterized protein n=1 Tax=Rangifer tarandus platyrhynchus TaxID=3082113 RepID=A0AC59Y670_RANTA